MTVRRSLLVGALLCCGLLLAGAVTAAPANGTGESIDDGANATESTQVGICVVGADSPCNGEQWDGDRPARTDESTVAVGSSGTVHTETGVAFPGLDFLVRLFGGFGLALF